MTREKRVGDPGCSIVELTNLARSSKSSSLLNNKTCSSLGLALELDLAGLNNLNTGHTVDIFSDILVLFVSQKSEAATVKALIKGLQSRNCLLNEIADLIQQKYFPESLPDVSTISLSSLPITDDGVPEIPSCNGNIRRNIPYETSSCTDNLEANEKDTFLQEGQRAVENLSATIQVDEKDQLKNQCIHTNRNRLLLIMTIAFLFVVTILLLVVGDKYLIKNDVIPHQIVHSQTSCLTNGNTFLEDCITVNTSSYSMYSMVMQNATAEKCIHLSVDELSSNNLPINFELQNSACIISISIKNVSRQSHIGYFLTKTLMVRNLSVVCQQRYLELDFKRTPKDILTITNLLIDNCDLSETLNYVRSSANFFDLTSIDVKNVVLTSENVMEITNIFTQSKNLQHVSIHVVNFDAYEIEIMFSTHLHHLKSFVLDVESPEKYFDIQPIDLANLCDKTSNLTLLKLSLGYLAIDNVRHLYKCTKLKDLEISIFLQLEEVDELAIDIQYQQLEKINLNLYFVNCPNYQKFQELYLDISHQCIKSCTISSNCQVAENEVYSLSC